MSDVYQKLQVCLESVRAKTDFQPEAALILGSGLGDYADGIDIEQTVDYTEIEGFPTSTVAGHKGRFVFGRVQGVPVVIMQGRVHYYEGYPMSDVVLPTRLMGLMGARKLILTNAAGGINPGFRPGCFMLLTDHITTGVPSPLIGPNVDELGPRFPDMSEVYSLRMRSAVKEAAAELNIPWGGDAVGMSTACEALAAKHMGLEVCGISCITNMAAGMSGKPLDHKEVQETADRVAVQFKQLITAVIGKI